MSMVVFVGAVLGLLFAVAVAFAIFSQFGGKLGLIGTSVGGLFTFLLGLMTSLYQFYGACALGGLGLIGYGLIISLVLLIIALLINGIDDAISGRTINPFGR